MSAPRIHLHIDQLVLRGLPAEQRDSLVASLHTELQRQLSAPGSDTRLGPSRELPRLRSAAALALHPSDGAANGRGIAQALLTELRR